MGADTVRDLLRAEGFRLQASAKTLEGKQHPDRDAQFRYINGQVKEHQDAGDPVISVDTKKKELVGEFKNAGREWRPEGEPAAARTHDFPGDSAGKAVPYGVYDLTADAGWVSVGTDHGTAAFAVESVRRWWTAAGSSDYPQARRLLITADAGGSNGYRTRAWKAGLAGLARETGLEITCCHFPPGTQCRCLTDRKITLRKWACGSGPGPGAVIGPGQGRYWPSVLVRVTAKPSAWICRMWLRSLRSVSVRAW